jgi:hypothetical protein
MNCEAKIDDSWVRCTLIEAYPDGDACVQYTGRVFVVSEWRSA